MVLKISTKSIKISMLNVRPWCLKSLYLLPFNLHVKLTYDFEQFFEQNIYTFFSIFAFDNTTLRIDFVLYIPKKIKWRITAA